MKFSRKSMMIGLLAAGLTATSGLALRGQAAGGGAGAPPAATYPAPTKLAVVNLVDLFDGLNEKTAADSAIEKMKKDYDDEVRKRAAKIDDAQKALGSTFKSGTPEFLKQQDDLLIVATRSWILIATTCRPNCKWNFAYAPPGCTAKSRSPWKITPRLTASPWSSWETTQT